MVVQHNLTAMNANRMLGVTTGQQAKSSEKLSSGYRINRAADDAAGLTISEKMRKQIKGLDQASTNAQDGVSAVQTAEGALTEVHSMLQRMNELATQASNGTNSEADRDAIQAEIEQLTTEIDRVAETTKFNEIYLLKGDSKGATTTKIINAHDAGLAGKLTDNGDGTSTFEVDKALEVGSKVTIAGQEYNIVEPAKASDYVSTKAVNDGLAAGDTLVKDGVKYTYVANSGHTQNGMTAGAAGWFADDNETTTPNALTVEAGDVYTKVGTTNAQTVIGSGTTDDYSTSPTAPPAWAAGDKAIIDGTEYTYYPANTTGASVAGFYVATPANNAATPDKTTTDASAVGTTYELANGTQGTIGTGINTVEAIQDNIKNLADATIVTIATKADWSDAKTYTVGAVTSAEDIANLVTGGSYVNNGANKFYAVPTASEDGKDISVQDAYRKMAAELEKASNIGTDETTKASVKNNGDGTFEITQGKAVIDKALSFSLHVGADADMTNKISVDIDTMSAAGLGIKGIDVSDDTGAAATYAIDAIADAIAKVSEQRSALGAVQNRLEHTIANLDNVVENTTSAESRIRDTDMAEEMVEYSKNNILAQAGQSMLAQANQSTQGVLSLLQ